MPAKKQLIVLGVAVLVGAVIVTVRVRDRGSADDAGESRENQPEITLGPAVADAEDAASYVGDAVCAECHADIAANYRRNGMARSWQPVTSDLPAHFHEESLVPDGEGLYQYQTLLNQSGQPIQRESLVANETAVAHSLERTARYLVGSGNHAQALVTESNGYLHQMPLAWFPLKGHWDLNPGYAEYNHRFNRPIAPECIACHATRAVHRFPTRNRYEQPVESGIGCERCHGPGAQHAAHWSHDETVAEDPIVNPGNLSPHRANDICLQCHLQGDVFLYEPGSHAFSFRPGDRLQDHRHDFLVQADGKEAFGVASHGARLLQSACYQQSESLTCFDCHDPHRPISDFTRADFDNGCIECHQPSNCGRPEASNDLRDGCVQCHMAQRPTREGIHLVFTDHWIRKQPSDIESSFALRPNDDVELVSPWPDANPDDVQLGSAYLLFHDTFGPQLPSLERGLQMLEQAGETRPLDSDARYRLASGLLNQRRSREAAELLRNLLRTSPDDLEARFRLGVAYSQLGEHTAARREYERAHSAAPDWIAPYSPLSRIYLFHGRAADAVRLLEHQQQFLPTAESLADLALARWMTGLPPTEALQMVKAGWELDPRSVRVHLVRGQLHAAAGDAPSAADAYRLVLEIEPGNPIAEEGLRALDAP